MNKVEKSLRWVVNQIPDFKPTTNEEKMLVSIKLYSEAGAEEIKRLAAENAALRERLEKAVELPFVPTDYHIETWLAEIKVSLTDESATIIVPVYIYQKFDNVEAAFVRLAELKGEKK